MNISDVSKSYISQHPTMLRDDNTGANRTATATNNVNISDQAQAG